eukprot:1530819-Lingulodinium_polyedra.AAC.1
MSSEGIERPIDAPSHGDVPMQKFWQPAVKPRPSYRGFVPWVGYASSYHKIPTCVISKYGATHEARNGCPST